MNPTGYTKIILSCLMAAVVVISVLVPVVYSSSMTTTTVSNEGAGWAKYAYYDEVTDYDIDLSSDGSTLTIGAQSGTASDMIVYASDVFSVLYAGDSFQLVAPSGSSADLGASASVASSSGTVTVTDSSNSAVYSSDAVSWAYVPDAAGDFGFFTDSGATINDYPVAAAGSSAGLITYNDCANYDAPVSFEKTITDGALSSVSWVGNSTAPVSKSFSFSSTEYTDGDWKFVKSNTDNTARIVKYIGAPVSELVIPGTVSDGTNAYDVVSISSAGTDTLIDGSTFTTDFIVKFPDSLEEIGAYSFTGVSNLTGDLILPDGVVYIGFNAFFNTGINGTVLIPESVYKIMGGPFTGMVAENLIICGTPQDVKSSSFYLNVSNVLNLGNFDIPVSDVSGVPTTATVEDYVPLMGYIAPATLSEQSPREGMVYDIVPYVPALMLVGLMLGVVGVVMTNRRA